MSRTSPLLLLLAVLLAGPARAQASQQVEIEVGHSAQINVGQASGLNCDDLSVVSAKVVTSKDKKHNTLVLKGLAAGSTYCRAGTGLGATVLIHVTVTEPEG